MTAPFLPLSPTFWAAIKFLPGYRIRVSGALLLLSLLLSLRRFNIIHSQLLSRVMPTIAHTDARSLKKHVRSEVPDPGLPVRAGRR